MTKNSVNMLILKSSENSYLSMPSFALAEVTDDERFTGGGLASTTHPQAKALLDEFNVK